MAPESTDIPSPTVDDPWRANWLMKSPVAYPQFGIFGSIPAPVASSLTAAGDKPVKYSQKTLCVEHADKTYAEMVTELEKFDPISAARDYNFTMSKSTDPVGKQITTRLREMRRLVFEVLPDHAHRHLKWWKTQCVLKNRTFRNHETDPVYVISLWATSIRSANKYQEFWARVLALIEDFDPEKLEDNLVLNQFLKQPFVRPGAVCLGITDSTYVGYAPVRYCPKQQERWDEDKVCDYKKGWRHERVGDWLERAMRSSVWPSRDWSFVHNWMALSPLSLSEAWKAAAAGPIVSLDQWTESTNNGSVKTWSKYLSTLMEPALQRAAGHRTPQTAILGPGILQ